MRHSRSEAFQVAWPPLPTDGELPPSRGRLPSAQPTRSRLATASRTAHLCPPPPAYARRDRSRDAGAGAAREGRSSIEVEGERRRFRGIVEAEWLTPFGKVMVLRRAYRADGRGKCTTVPLDDACGMPGRFMTSVIEEMAALGMAMLTAPEVAQIIGKALPEAPSATAIQNAVHQRGDEVALRRALAREAGVAGPASRRRANADRSAGALGEAVLGGTPPSGSPCRGAPPSSSHFPRPSESARRRGFAGSAALLPRDAVQEPSRRSAAACRP